MEESKIGANDSNASGDGSSRLGFETSSSYRICPRQVGHNISSRLVVVVVRTIRRHRRHQ